MSSEAGTDQVSAFIARWKSSAAAEQANYQLFLSELCDLLGVLRPRHALAAQPGVITAEQLARKFMRACVERVEELLQTLVPLGQAREAEPGRFAA